MNLEALDKEIFLKINDFVGEVPVFDQLVKLVVNEYFVPVSIGLVLLFLWFHPGKKRKNHRKALPIAILSVTVVNITIIVMNQFIISSRPFDQLSADLLFYRPTDPSFPSNAAAVGFALATAISLVNRKLGFGAIILALFYGFSRVYVGVHFPSDVIAGALLGVLVALMISRLRLLVNSLTELLEKIQTKIKLDLDY